MHGALRSIAVAACAALGAASALAADQEILGKRLQLRDPHGDEAYRSVMITGREAATDIDAIVGDPVASGATLMLGIDSGDAGQLFVLDASGWSRTASGFRYQGPTASGAPVRRVVLRRTTSGVASLEILLRGSVGSAPLELVPPDPGADAVAVLTLGGGDTFCVSLGGAARGQVVTSTSAAWRIVDATAEPSCPTFCCSFGASCAWGDGTEAAFCAELGGTLGFPGTVCDGASGACGSPPAAPGSCCEFGGGALCFGGPGVQQPPCDEVGGTFSSSAICDPSQGCVAP